MTKRRYPPRRSSSTTRIAYQPLDVALAVPDVRILRTLRHFDLVSKGDLHEALDLPSDSRIRNRFDVALSRLVRTGCVGRLIALGGTWYRITDRGRRELEQRLDVDMLAEWAPARPGTEHLLCA